MLTTKKWKGTGQRMRRIGQGQEKERTEQGQAGISYRQERGSGQSPNL